MVQRGQFLDSGGGRVAYVVGADGMAVRREIETGARSLAAVEIVPASRQATRIVISSSMRSRAETVLVTD